MATTTGTGASPVVAATAVPSPEAPPRRQRLRTSLLTTPGRLRALSVCLVIGVYLSLSGIATQKNFRLLDFLYSLAKA